MNTIELKISMENLITSNVYGSAGGCLPGLYHISVVKERHSLIVVEERDSPSVVEERDSPSVV